MNFFQSLTIFILLAFPVVVLAGQELVSVKIAVSEGLSLADSTSSERYRQALESSLYYAIGENEKELNSNHNVQSLDYEWEGAVMGLSYTSYAMVQWVRRVARDLCQFHPKSREEYIRQASTYKLDHFKTIDKIGVYKLHGAQLGFSYSLDK